MASSSHRSLKYHVFLSFRGEDTRKTYVDHLYTALSNKSIYTYKDDQALPRGDSIGPSLLNAIKGSLIAIVVFSENYANSSWCLDELAHIMKCRKERGLIVIPIFYKVDPSHVRKQEGNFGRAFAEKKRGDDTKKDSWRQAIVDASTIVDASNIAGWVTDDLAHGYESEGIKLIVDTISKRLFPLYPYINEKLVGMESRLKSLNSLLDIESGGVHMVGIWGVGGSGKTTLAHFAYRHFSHQFDRHCFIGKIREKSAKRALEKLQEEVLSSLLKTDEKVQIVEEGQHKIASILSLSPILIVLDDVDDDSQIEALAGSHEWFGDGSRIIITTRDEHLLHRDNVKIYHVGLLPPDEAIQLLEKHALLKDKPPIEDYDTLSRRVISYADGLPLALKVLGSLLRGKEKKGWESALDKMKNIPNLEIIHTLKISYDGLEPNERELFLDIACFHRGNNVNHVMKILDACDFYPDDGIVLLRDKALITISDGMLEMHDLVQKMGHYVVRNQHPKEPEKRSRVWKTNEILEMCYNDSAMENNEIEAIRFGGNSSVFFKLVSNMKKLRLLLVDATEGAHDYSVQGVEAPSFLSNELKYIDYAYYPGSPFPADFQPRKLVVLMLPNTLQKELWQGCKVLPQLKELYLEDAEKLVSTPDFDGLPCLENLRLNRCSSLEEIDPSLGYRNSLVHVFVSDCENLRSFPTIFSLKKLKTLEIENCKELVEFPEIQASMDSLIKLYLRCVGIHVLPASSIGKYCTNLILLKLEHCIHLKRIEGNFQDLKQLENFELNGLFNLEKLPSKLFNSECSLKRLDLSDCQMEDGEIPGDVGELLNLTELDLSGNNFSRLPFSLLRLTQLKLLSLRHCYNLLELPECASSIDILTYGLQSLKSRKYDVFLSFRGEDTSKNYSSYSQKTMLILLGVWMNLNTL
ncbi:TMV resistance protein N-like [Rutidosis leptorrhynchoides]|uniref:TMV resistance protein N-like n=1 Tax=Rutidosis leptorrhynchoides TaxID=125765 RepID=UPI003A997C8A